MSNSTDLNDGLKVADLVVRYVKALLLFKIIIFNLIFLKKQIYGILHQYLNTYIIFIIILYYT